MANEKTVISIEVEGTGKAINSIKELKAELKAAQSAALNGDGKAAKRVAELKDKMDDLKDTTKSLQGSGVEKISSSFSLLGQGFKDFDTDKIATGFKGVGSAMKAIPIFLLIEGISYLVENWKELSEGNGFIAKSLQFLGSIFTAIIDQIYAFTDALGLTNSELDKQGEAMKANAEKGKEALTGQIAEFDRQMTVAKAAGKSTVEIEKLKQKAIIDTNLEIARGIEAHVRAGGQFTDQMKKDLSASLEMIKNAKVQEYVITETDNTAKKEQYKKHLEDKEKLEEEKQKREDAIAKGNKKLEQDRREQDKKYQAEEDAEEAALAERNKKALDEKHKRQIEQDNQDVKDFQDKEAAKTKAEKNRVDGGFALAKTSLESTQALSDIFFANKLSKAKKGSAEETAIAKKQFEVNKALQIAQAVMQGAQAVLAAYASGSAIPIVGAVAGPLYAVAAGLVAIKNIQTIKNAQFGGGAPAAPDTSGGNVSIPSSNGTPNIAPPTSQQPSTTFTGNVNNNYQPVKAFVTETDIRHSSKRIDTLQSQATY